MTSCSIMLQKVVNSQRVVLWHENQIIWLRLMTNWHPNDHCWDCNTILNNATCVKNRCVGGEEVHFNSWFKYFYFSDVTDWTRCFVTSGVSTWVLINPRVVRMGRTFSDQHDLFGIKHYRKTLSVFACFWLRVRVMMTRNTGYVDPEMSTTKYGPIFGLILTRHFVNQL